MKWATVIITKDKKRIYFENLYQAHEYQKWFPEKVDRIRLVKLKYI